MKCQLVLTNEYQHGTLNKLVRKYFIVAASKPGYSALKKRLGTRIVATFAVMFKTELNTLRPRQNGRHFAEDISMRILLIENVWISIKISPNFVPMGQINNIRALV